MTMPFDRRRFLGTAATAAATALATPGLMMPEQAFAASAPADWRLGVADIDTDISLRSMKLVAGKAPAGLSGTLYRNGPATFRRGTSAAGH